MGPARGSSLATLAHQVRFRACLLGDAGDFLIVIVGDRPGFNLAFHLQTPAWRLVVVRRDSAGFDLAFQLQTVTDSLIVVQSQRTGFDL
jgi:hypothetical protein